MEVYEWIGEPEYDETGKMAIFKKDNYIQVENNFINFLNDFTVLFESSVVFEDKIAFYFALSSQEDINNYIIALALYMSGDNPTLELMCGVENKSESWKDYVFSDYKDKKFFMLENDSGTLNLYIENEKVISIDNFIEVASQGPQGKYIIFGQGLMSNYQGENNEVNIGQIRLFDRVLSEEEKDCFYKFYNKIFENDENVGDNKNVEDDENVECSNEFENRYEIIKKRSDFDGGDYSIKMDLVIKEKIGTILSYFYGGSSANYNDNEASGFKVYFNSENKALIHYSYRGSDGNVYSKTVDFTEYVKLNKENRFNFIYGKNNISFTINDKVLVKMTDASTIFQSFDNGDFIIGASDYQDGSGHTYDDYSVFCLINLEYTKL